MFFFVFFFVAFVILVVVPKRPSADSAPRATDFDFSWVPGFLMSFVFSASLRLCVDLFFDRGFPGPVS